MTKENKQINITVYAPRSTEPKTFIWDKTFKVGDAADEAALAFGYSSGTHSFQNEDDEVLDRQKPFVAENVKDGDTLELVDSGGGV